MKSFIRSYVIDIGALLVISKLVSALQISGGLKGILIGGFAFMLANWFLVPLLKILFLPLNLLTLGIFGWLSNVLALYILVSALPYFKLSPYFFPGWNIGGFIIPSMELTTFEIAIVTSLLIGIIIHFIHWLIK